MLHLATLVHTMYITSSSSAVNLVLICKRLLKQMLQSLDIGGASAQSACWLARWRHLLETHALHVGGATVCLMEFLAESV